MRETLEIYFRTRSQLRKLSNANIKEGWFRFYETLEIVLDSDTHAKNAKIGFSEKDPYDAMI